VAAAEAAAAATAQIPALRDIYIVLILIPLGAVCALCTSRCLHGEIVLTRESERESEAIASEPSVSMYLYLCALGSMQLIRQIGGALSLFLPRGDQCKRSHRPNTHNTVLIAG
jgi:hypothetical protein